VNRRPGLLWGAGAVALAAGLLVAVLGPDSQRFAGAPEAERLQPPLAAGATVAAPARTGAPPEVRAAAREWPLPNGDYANTRSAAGSSIRASNVGRLGLGWSLRLRRSSHWGAAASGPLIAGGVVYFQDLRSNVWALEAASGAERWHRKVSQDAFGPNGPALGWGKVFAHDGENSVRAFDIRTGREVWRSALDGPTGSQQPTAFGGFVYTAVSAGRKLDVPRRKLHMRLLGPGSSGYIYGLRADTGRRVWDFRTVAPGFWGDEHHNAGAGVWAPPAIDPATGTTFWSTGNPAPAPGILGAPNAESRPGRNLYSNSVLAFDGRAGKRLWFNQPQRHDLLHHDLQNPNMLVRAGGRNLVIASGKAGVVFAMDRDTGKMIWKRPVGRHLHDGLRAMPADDRPVRVFPGFWGGIEAPGAAAGGTLYFQVVNCPTPYTATAWHSSNASQNVQNLEGRTQLDRGTSEVVALDAATGRVRWTHQFSQVGFGATTVVNDLVFTATYDGTMFALRRRDGREIWSFHGPAGINAWPAVAGDTIVWPAGIGRTPALLGLRLGGAAPHVEARTRVHGATR
jgi:outer membrane protein assembly factor BamB